MADRAAYDYVIVGAGSAGCVLAYRLTADPAIRVLLLEAGGRDTHPLIHVPIGLGKIWEHRMFDWGYDTEPEPRLDGRRIEAMRGKAPGGSAANNLTVETNALATRVSLEGSRATGVEYARTGRLHRASATREVLLAGGVFNTPQLLMLSGIGEPEHLREVGLEPKVSLPGVGRNLQDHLSVDVHHTRRGRGPFHAEMRLDRTALNMARAYLLGTGPGTVLPSRLHAFLKTRRDLAVPDIQFLFRGAPARAHPWFPGNTPAYEDSFGLRPVMLHPESRGVVRLRSSDPSAPVRIVQNFLATEHAVRKIREGVKLGRDIASRNALAGLRGRETAPGPDCRTDRKSVA